MNLLGSYLVFYLRSNLLAQLGPEVSQQQQHPLENPGVALFWNEDFLSFEYYIYI